MNSGSRSEVGVADESSRTTPVKRRRLLPLVDLRNPGCGPNLSYKDRVSPSTEVCHVMEFSGSASVGAGRRSRPALTDLTKSGFCGILECGEPSDASKVSTLGSAKVLTKGISDPRDGTMSRFPRLDQCAHFHYEFVELPPIQVLLVTEELKPLSQGMVCEDIENKSLLVQVTSLGRSWVVRRTYDNFRFLDKQLHRCCYDRKISQLQELAPEENLPRGDELDCVESLLEKYLCRLSHIAGSLITCGPVLGWLELDNRGHRLIVTDDSDINTPAVAAAYVIKRYNAQASDEISFEVGDMISVIDMPPPEESIWWRGKRGFQVGFFPCECVQVIEGKVPQGIHPQALALPLKRSGGNTHAHSYLHAAHSFSGTQEPLKPVLRKHGKLIAFFRSFILSRPPRPWLKRSGILRERVFGCDLAEHLLNSGHDIPMVLKCCAEFIETHGTVDGIYRLSGITSNIQKLRNAFDEERVPALYEDESILQDIHCVSSVLKMYFRELPNPLLTYQLYAKFSQAVVQDEGVRLLHVRDVVQQLPPPHYRTLEYLVRHLARIASFSNTTGMTPKNIAIVWAPNLLRSKDLERGGVAALQDVGTQAVVTEYLVRYVDLIFNDKIPNFSPSALAARDRSEKLPRPKSLAISTPVKLLSIDEARNRSLAAIKCDQNYIDVGGGPNSLPQTYHTVIDIRNRKGGSLKQKKSPLGWKTFFWKNKHPPKKAFPANARSTNASNALAGLDGDEQPSKRLRPTQSVESLSSNGAQIHCTINETVAAHETNSLRSVPFTEKERSLSSLSSPTPSPRTHSRSFSHDSYFILLDQRMAAASTSTSKTSKDSTSTTESESATGPKFELELRELNTEFKLSESDIRLFSEDDTLRSTSMDTASRTTLADTAEGGCRSPLYLLGRVSRPLKRNLLRSSSEDFKCVALSPADAAARPDKQYRSSGNLPKKYPRLSGDPKRSVVRPSHDEAGDFGDKSPSRDGLDTGALIEPDLLERITRMRSASADEMGSVESLPAAVQTIEEMVLKPRIQASIDEDSPSDDIAVSPDVFRRETFVPIDDVVSPLGGTTGHPTDVRFAFTCVDKMSPSSTVPGMGFNPAVAAISPETPLGAEPHCGEIQYDQLSEATEPSTASDDNRPAASAQTPSDISCDSLSAVVSPTDTPLDGNARRMPSTSSSEVEYEALSECSDAADPADEPQYTNVERLREAPMASAENHYENIDIRANVVSDAVRGAFGRTCTTVYDEDCNFAAQASEAAAAAADQSVYQQVKYLRRSIQEVNEILSDTAPLSQPQPPVNEKRKSVTTMTIHFRLSVSSDSDPQTSPDIGVEEPAEPAATSSSIIKEIFTLTEKPPASGSHATRLVSSSPEGCDAAVARELRPADADRSSEISPPIGSRRKPSRPIDIVAPQRVEVEPSHSSSLRDSTRDQSFLGHAPHLEEEEQSAAAVEITAHNGTAGVTARTGLSTDVVVSPVRPVPLPRTSFDKPRGGPLTGKCHASRSLTPPAKESDTFDHPSTSLPADLARDPDGCRNRTWPFPGGDHHESTADCCPPAEADSHKRERIEKYKEERRSILRRNYHPNSFKGENDAVLRRFKQKATNPVGVATDGDKSGMDRNSGQSATVFADTTPKICESRSVPKVVHLTGTSAASVAPRDCSVASDAMKFAKDSHPASDFVRSATDPQPKPIVLKKSQLLSSCGKPDAKEVTVRQRVAIWAQQQGSTGTTSAAVVPPETNNPPAKSSPVVIIQEVKDSHRAPTSYSVHNNGFGSNQQHHRPCVKSQSSDSIAHQRTSPAALPFQSVGGEIASRRASDAGRMRLHQGCGGYTSPKQQLARKLSAFEPAAKTHGNSIGQDKIRAIAAQFEPEVKCNSQAYLRQISK